MIPGKSFKSAKLGKKGEIKHVPQNPLLQARLPAVQIQLEKKGGGGVNLSYYWSQEKASNQRLRSMRAGLISV